MPKKKKKNNVLKQTNLVKPVFEIVEHKKKKAKVEEITRSRSKGDAMPFTTTPDIKMAFERNKDEVINHNTYVAGKWSSILKMGIMHEWAAGEWRRENFIKGMASSLNRIETLNPGFYNLVMETANSLSSEGKREFWNQFNNTFLQFYFENRDDRFNYETNGNLQTYDEGFVNFTMGLKRNLTVSKVFKDNELLKDFAQAMQEYVDNGNFEIEE